MRVRRWVAAIACLALVGGCADGSQDGGDDGAASVLPPSGGGSVQTSPTGDNGTITSPSTGTSPGTTQPTVGGAAGSAAPAPTDGSATPTDPTIGQTDPTTDPVQGTADPSTPSTPAGPEDGDPNAPIVEVPGVACGSNPSLFGLTSTNHSIGGRDVHVAYPCNKHAGAPVTFVLNLHGTMPSEDLKLYQVAYFSINEYADSHNIISVAPKSVVSQWGNGDGGVDKPHLMEVIDWVYSTFSELDIRAMWVSGHSWGSMYTATFACDPALADKVRGVVMESGSGAPPACADRISVISSAAENDIGPVIPQGGIAAGHGCGAEQTNMLGNNIETHWPSCNPGFVHANYFMLGKAHADYMDAVVVERIADLIVEARP